MVKAIAKELGLTKIVYIQNNFQTMYLPGPKRWDIGLAEMTITAERKKNIDFSVPYINANQGVMVRKGLTDLPKSLDDLKGLVLCAQIGTTGAAYIKDRVQPDKQALYPQTTTIMYQQLKSKRCDAALYDAPILGAQKFQEPKAYGPIVGQIITNEQYGAAFQKGSKLRPPSTRRSRSCSPTARSASRRRSGSRSTPRSCPSSSSRAPPSRTAAAPGPQGPADRPGPAGRSMPASP